MKLFPTLFKSIKKFYAAQFDVTFFPDAYEDNCFCGPYSFEVKMASDMDVCTNYPDFAVICSFIENFSEKLKLNLPNIEELQLLLENTENVNPNLAQLVAQLLRKINKSVKYDKWERGLQRFAHTYSHQDGWELERFGFKKAKLEVKIRVFKNLLETQFDGYKSFKEKVNLVSAKELRLQPCGRDKHGVSYWCQLDEFANLRVYRDDQDEETWKLVARSREELVELIDELEKKNPSSIGRETSVDESESGITTPMVLSEAPTPVDSKAATPVTSGRTSPVLDTGQVKDKLNESESVVQTSKLSTEVIAKKEKVEKKRKQSREEESSETVPSSDGSLTNNKDIPAIDNPDKPREVNLVKNVEEKPETKTDLVTKAKSNESLPTEVHKTIDLRSNIKKTESPEFKKKASNLDAIINMSVSKSVGEKLGGKLEAKVAAIKELPPPSLRKEKLLTSKENIVKRDGKHPNSSNEEKEKSLQETAYKEVSVKQLPTKIPKEPDKNVRLEEEKRKLDEQGEFEPINKKSKLDTMNESQNTSQSKIGEKSLEPSVKSVPTSKKLSSVEEIESNEKSVKKIPEISQQVDTKNIAK
ncbi:Remodeling and spacing factor 1 [Armadillidium nasatum]|uniref:Remodeling and spacing factor 1 n=1 Tax=Armadillidium nasatum TaxID=96803 RepID=A0A5N5T6B6_9CRUS|nr:Remodeling and spacing factor 1 [Armadillidium nasatum]